MDTECDVDRAAGRGFNLSALYALLPLVNVVGTVTYFVRNFYLSIVIHNYVSIIIIELCSLTFFRFILTFHECVH